MLVLSFAIEFFRVTLDVEPRCAQPVGHFDDAHVSFGVEFGQVEYHLAQLAQKQVAGLAAGVQVLARG